MGKIMTKSVLARTAVLASCLGPVVALVRPNGVGRLPALGWNSWNAYGCNVDEAKIVAAAQNLTDLGLKAAGYEYVNIDDCWSVKSGRDNVTHRIIPDPTKFPEGISGTAAKIHAMGFKIGIYSSAGTQTCAGYPASIGHEMIDATAFAEWGIDYLKYDNCNVPANWTDACNACVPDGSPNHGNYTQTNGTCTNTTGLCNDNFLTMGYDWAASNTADRYMIMRNALEAQNRTILYSLCEWGQADVNSWGNSTGNSWRMSDDIFPYWARVVEILNLLTFELDYSNFWGHPDPDMLEVGNGNLTAAESRSHFALWAALKSPLLIGTGNFTKLTVDILSNKYLLAFNQDPVYGAPAMPYKWGINPDWTFNESYPAQYYSGHSKAGTLVLMLNTLGSTETMRADWADIPGLQSGGTYKVTDAWTGQSYGCVKDGSNQAVASHDTAVLLVQEGCGYGINQGDNGWRGGRGGHNGGGHNEGGWGGGGYGEGGYGEGGYGEGGYGEDGYGEGGRNGGGYNGGRWGPPARRARRSVV